MSVVSRCDYCGSCTCQGQTHLTTSSIGSSHEGNEVRMKPGIGGCSCRLCARGGAFAEAQASSREIKEHSNRRRRNSDAEMDLKGKGNPSIDHHHSQSSGLFEPYHKLSPKYLIKDSTPSMLSPNTFPACHSMYNIISHCIATSSKACR